MSSDDERRKLIEQYLATRRRIRGTEEKALKKLGTTAPDGATCSFCGAAQKDQVFLIQGTGEARICSACVRQVSGMLKDDDD